MGVGHPLSNGDYVETLSGTVGHKSFIRLAPFGFTGLRANESTLDASVAVSIEKVTPEVAKAANFTDMPNRTVFYLMLCGEEEWETIVETRPSYCGTESYQKSALCKNMPLAPLQHAGGDTYKSFTVVRHVVKRMSYARLVFSSCELNGPDLAKLRSQVKGALNKDKVTINLKIEHTMRNGDHYVGWEDASRQPGLYIFECLYCIFVFVWVARGLIITMLGRCCPLRCPAARAAVAGGQLHARMINILITKIIELSWQQAYWFKMDRGDKRALFADEMRGVLIALEICSQCAVFEIILLVSVGYKITQNKLRSKAWNIVYGPLFAYMISGILSGSAVGLRVPLLHLVGILLYVSVTFYVYYIICYGASANIEALMEQMLLVRRMRINPKSTPSYAKLTMFRKFRIWMTVLVSSDVVMVIVQAILGGEDSNEQYEGMISILNNSIEFIFAVSLFYVFWPGRSNDAYFRPIAVVEGTAMVPPLPNDQLDVVGAEVVPEASALAIPVTSDVTLTEWQPDQPLPAILVGTVIGGDSTSRNASSGLTEVHPVRTSQCNHMGGEEDTRTINNTF